MEERRTTRSRRVRFSERQTRRQQRGGARNPSDSIPTISALSKPSTESFLRRVFAEAPFNFLLDPNWTTTGDAAKNYTTLIMKQDELFIRWLDVVKEELHITDDTPEATLVSSVLDASQTVITNYIESLIEIVKIIGLDKNLRAEDTMAPPGTIPGSYMATTTNKTKFQYNLLSKPTDISNTRKLINILLYPSLLTNITIKGIATILNQLKSEKNTTLAYIDVSEDAPHKFTATDILSDKFTWYLRSLAATETNDQLRDSLCIWGAAYTGETFWQEFFYLFLYEYALNREKTNLSITAIDNDIKRTSYLEEMSYKIPADYVSYTDANQDLILGSWMVAIILDLYKDGATQTDILQAFAVERTPALTATPAADGAIKNAANVNSLTGMLPESAWGQPIIDTPAGATPITFRALLNHLSPRYIHFLLHLTEVLFRPEPAAAAP
jgi:hypothetical protein